MPTPNIQPHRPGHQHPLHGVQATRDIEQVALHRSPDHSLIEPAGRAVARLSQAIAPHAKRVVVVCGPGLNGADGLMAAHALCVSGHTGVTLINLQGENPSPPRQQALNKARAAGANEGNDTDLDTADLVIDALLGIGMRTPLPDRLAQWCVRLNQLVCPVLCVDAPSGLDCDSGQALFDAVTPPSPRHTLSLLTLKPGLFTAQGRDMAGDVWLDTLGHADLLHTTPASAHWFAPGHRVWTTSAPHHSHKGSHGDVMVIGGDQGHTSGHRMVGAAVLAARAALGAGAGRVYLGLLGDNHRSDPHLIFDTVEPGLMLKRPTDALAMPRSTVFVCGCGAGDALGELLPSLLASPHPMVLDADALNLLAKGKDKLSLLMQERAQRGLFTVITPHPLEAARLCDMGVAEVQRQRLAVAAQLSQRWGCVTVLKGSGTVVSSPSGDTSINASGNGKLATAGTGDVLAGMIGAQLARCGPSSLSVRTAVYAHGLMADVWPDTLPLTASRLAAAARPMA